MIELSRYAFESLRTDPEFILYRAHRSSFAKASSFAEASEDKSQDKSEDEYEDKEPSSVLVLAPALEQPELGTLKRLEHECSLRDELDPEWTVRPIELTHHWGRSVLVLENPGGVPLESACGRFGLAAAGAYGRESDGLELTLFLQVAISLANAIGHVHRKGLIHKDIKPANILADPVSNKAWFTGFGISSRLKRERQAAELPEMIAGTLAYMAPEQTGRMNRSIDSRSDLYSLGVTFYQMLTGCLPFTASDPMDWVHCHLARQPQPPAERVGSVPKAISAIIMKLLAKTAEERYQTATGLEADLRRCLDEYLTSSGVTVVQEKISEFPLGQHDTPDRLFIPEKLYGRQHEIETLLASFDRVVLNGRPELVLISGYSGIGKSSVVNELHRVLVSPRGLFTAGKFDQYKRDIPYSTLAQAFLGLIRPLLAKNEAELDKWREALREALGGASGRLIIDLVPELKFITGEQPPVTPLPMQDAQRHFQLVFRRFINVFAQPEHPLALFLDDLQWIDVATLDLLEDLLISDFADQRSPSPQDLCRGQPSGCENLVVAGRAVVCEAGSDPAEPELGRTLRPDVHHLLLIGAYRDNEVTASHPLARKLDAIRKRGAQIQEIHLLPLAREDLEQLIAESTRSEPEDAKPLAQLLHEKTAGNPFFAKQFLSTLAEEGLLSFDHEHGRWSWDLDRIRAKGYTDNVADLMVGKLQCLPVETQDALQRFACVGSIADAATLSVVLGKTEEEVHADLWNAVRQELVQVFTPVIGQDRELRLLPDNLGDLGNANCDLSDINSVKAEPRTVYRFAHDRIQEAAYSLIAEGSRAQAHLRIGRLLLARTPPEHRDEAVFEIVNQLNRGSRLIISQDERDRLAELNLLAGKRAKMSIAYAAALKCLATGVDLLASDCWQRQHQLALGLWLERAECEFLNGDFDAAERLIAGLLSRGISNIDKAAVYRLKILLHTMKAQPRQAVESGLECLRLLDIEIPARPTREQLQAEYQKIWQLLGERSIESIVELPLMVDEQKRAAMQVLSEIRAPANNTDVNLHYLITCLMVNLSLSYGTTDASTHGYAGLATILGPVFHRYVDAYRFAKLACNLADKYGFQAYKAKAYLIMEVVALWTEPVDTAIDLARLAFRAGVETGDLSFACYACNHLITDLLLKGCHLDEVWRESEKCLEFDRKAKFPDAADIIVSQQRFIQCLLGYTFALSSFSDAEFDEERFEAQLTEDRMTSMICYYWILKLEARFLCRDYEAANTAALKAERLLWSAEMHIQSASYYYYHALTMAGLYDRVSANKQAECLTALRQSLERLQEWAATCPSTFLEKQRLLSAELARIQGRDLEAMRLYEEAIRLSHENGFIQNEGIANELAAAFYAARGFESIADLYLRRARYCYLRWGADGKVRQLDEIYPQLRTEEPAPSPTGTVEAPPERLDLATVSRVSQAVSSEIVLEKLIETLLKIALEQAGADRGLLILPQNVLTSSRPVKGEHHQIEAEIKSGADQVEVQLRKAPVTSAELPDSLLRYVLRTQQHVILDDASVQNLFSEDEYIRQKHPRSVLFLPLVKQTKLMGVLYLENNLAPGVFTPKRLTMLELLASQAAISLDHARVYAELSRENSDRRKAEEALRASEQRLQDIIDNTPAVVTVKDLDLHYLLINREHERRFQVQRDQIRGKTDYDFLPRDVAEKIRANDWQVIEAGSPVQFEVTTPMTESERHYVVVKFLLRDGTGKPYAVCGISTDITERKQAEEARQKAQAELAHVTRVATLGELAGSIAHEVKQPLTAIINNADACLALLPGEISKLEDVREALSDIISDADRASAVVERIRGLIKKSPPQKARLDLNETIGGVIALARGELNSNGVLLRTKLANDLPLIMGDRIHLQQVILNLVINGIEAMRGVTNAPRELWISSEKMGAAPDLVDAGQETRNPQLSTRSVLRSLGEKGSSEQAYILVSVADSGPGLDPNILSRLFDAFYTTKPEGLGMGLTISRSIVEAHGGRLWATANVPKGALFQFTLPVAND